MSGPLLLIGQYRPVIGIDRMAMYPVDSKLDSAVDLEIPFNITADFPDPRTLRPVIKAQLDQSVVNTGSIGLTVVQASEATSRIRGALNDLQSAGDAGGFSTADATTLTAVNTDCETLYTRMHGSKFVDSVLSFDPDTSTDVTATIATLRNKIAKALHDAYVANNPSGTQTKLDNAVKAVFFDEKVAADGGISFSNAAVLPNVVGKPEISGTDETYENNLMTGLIFNKGLNSALISDLDTFYTRMCEADELIKYGANDSSENLRLARSAQRRTFAALMQAIDDFITTYEQVEAWDTKSTGTGTSSSAGDDAVILVPGSAFAETRLAARARSACRVYALYAHFFGGSSTTFGTPGKEFNQGFSFEVDDANAVDPSSKRVALISGGSHTVSDALNKSADLTVDWNITNTNLALRQLYYFRSTSNSQSPGGGITFVPVSVTIVQS
jgi:hypothetical protein